MEWLATSSQNTPEMAVYLAIGSDTDRGAKVSWSRLGVVTGSLLGGILLVIFFHVPVSDQAKVDAVLTLPFRIGYSVGLASLASQGGLRW